MKKYGWYGLSFLVLLVCALCSAQVEVNPGSLTVAGELPRTGELTQADLENLNPAEVEFTLKDGTHRFRGVPLDRVLEHFGFDKGPDTPETPPVVKRYGWKKVLVASAPDGFQAVFSCAELNPTMGRTKAFLVWQMDGKALPPDAGAFRLIVPSDQERARCIYQLNRIDIIDMRKIIQPAGGEKIDGAH